jgi:hypothetical protein
MSSLLRNQLLQRNAAHLKQLQGTLTPDHRRILDYFWDEKEQRLRFSLPQSVIYFFETDGFDETQAAVIRAQVDVLTFALETKHYIFNNSSQENVYFKKNSSQQSVYFKLTPQGVEYLKDLHPTVLNYLKKLLGLSPPLLTLIVTLIGFVASIFGIIQFVAWLRGSP